MNELMKHQIDALAFLAKTPKAALFMPTGTGKTLVSLLYVKELGKRALIVVEASKKHIWVDENKKFNLGLDMSTDWRGNNDIIIVSYDWLKNNAELLEDFEVVVFDEAHCISSPDTVRYKNLSEIVKSKPHVILLSGYPVENHLQEIYVVSLISDVLGQNYYHFLHKFFNVIRHNGRIIKVTPRKGSFDRIIELIKPIAFVVDKEKVMVNNIKKESIITRFDLSDQQKSIINDLCHTGQYRNADLGIMLSCKNRLVVFQKIMQVISGFVYDTNDESEMFPIMLNANPKLSLLDRITKDKSNFLLWYFYDVEKDMLAKYDGVCRLCKLQTDSRGLNLQSYKFSVYYTLPLSGGQFMQSQDRLYRIGRETDVLSITMLPNGEFGDRLASMMNRKHKLTKDFIEELLRTGV